VYEYGDDGGILVMVPNQQNVYTAYYSLDEGLTWNAVNFSTPDKPMWVINLFSTSSSGEKFVIFGWYGGPIAYIVIDLSGIRENTCNINTDYEEWSLNSNCVLGRNTVYRRRKRTAECSNPDGISHVVSVTNCNCTVSDYECDYGFEKTISSGKCVSILDDEEEQMYINEQCMDPGNQGSYEVSKGYRIVPSDSCVNPLPQYQPTWHPCTSPSTSTTSGSSTSHSASSSDIFSNTLANSAMIGLLTIAFLIVTLGSLVGGMVMGARSDRIRKVFGRRGDSPRYSRVGTDDHEETELT